MTMQCPKCGSENNLVIDTRTLRESKPLDTAVVRKRECCDCGCRWMTTEEFWREVGEDYSNRRKPGFKAEQNMRAREKLKPYAKKKSRNEKRERKIVVARRKQNIQIDGAGQAEGTEQAAV